MSNFWENGLVGDVVDETLLEHDPTEQIAGDEGARTPATKSKSRMRASRPAAR